MALAVVSVGERTSSSSPAHLLSLVDLNSVPDEVLLFSRLLSLSRPNFSMSVFWLSVVSLGISLVGNIEKLVKLNFG